VSIKGLKANMYIWEIETRDQIRGQSRNPHPAYLRQSIKDLNILLKKRGLDYINHYPMKRFKRVAKNMPAFRKSS
jgi:hypothetical protein